MKITYSPARANKLKQQELETNERVSEKRVIEDRNKCSKMHFNSVSNSKLHCCLAALILFILIFLSIPLLLIWVANNHYEESQNELTGPGPGGRMPSGRLSTQTAPTESSSSSSSSSSTSSSVSNSFSSNQHSQEINCTQFAAQADLSLVGENRKYPPNLVSAGSMLNRASLARHLQLGPMTPLEASPRSSDK